MNQIPLVVELPKNFKPYVEACDMDTAVELAGQALRAIDKLNNDNPNWTLREKAAVASLANYLLCISDHRLLALLEEVCEREDCPRDAKTVAMGAVIAGQNAPSYGSKPEGETN